MKVQCKICGVEVEDKDLMNCPQCGTRYIPNKVGDDITFKINAGDLRTLTYWAERWAIHCKDEPEMQKVVYATVQRIRAALPEDRKGMGLTLSGELQELKAAYPGMKVYDSNGKEQELGGL